MARTLFPLSSAELKVTSIALMQPVCGLLFFRFEGVGSLERLTSTVSITVSDFKFIHVILLVSDVRRATPASVLEQSSTTKLEVADLITFVGRV